MNSWDSRLRFFVYRLAIVAALGAVVLKLWNLQIVSAEKYQESADANQYRLLPVNAPRGVIYDRTGRLLVRNVPSFAVSIVPGMLPEDEEARRAVLERVGELIGMPVDEASIAQAPATPTPEATEPTPTPEEAADEEQGTPVASPPSTDTIEGILLARTVNPNQPVRIKSNVDRDSAFILEEEHLNLPGVRVELESRREYTEGELMGHIMGYMSRIPEETVDEYLADESFAYTPSDVVGMAGVEYSLEETLRGQKGQKHVQVDAYEREIRVVAEEPPEPGNSAMLTIDVDLQRVAEEALRKQMALANSKNGAVVVMDPRTGEVLAIVSLPGYDNNLFSGGISYEDYARLASDPAHPLVNHAISGQYPPGSIFKVISAAASLQAGAITTGTTVHCGGVMLLPNKFAPNNLGLAQPFYCWNLGGHGTVNVHEALVQSCNIFFNQVVGGYKDLPGLGMEKLGEAMRMFGLGAPTGIDLPGEASGLVPTDYWKRMTFDEQWMTGDTYNAAIGQGFDLVTPLQMANVISAIANGGTLYRPQLVYQVIAPDGTVVDALVPEPIRQLDVDPQYLEVIRDALADGVSRGTGYAARLPGISVAGKTGSAQFTRWDENGNLILDNRGRLPTHAWFSTFAPVENPEIAMVVFLDHGGEGSTRAAPVAAEIYRYYFGIPDPSAKPTPTPAGG